MDPERVKPVLTLRGGGMDKKFYWKEGLRFGWLQVVRDPAVKERELTARKAIIALGTQVRLPEIKDVMSDDEKPLISDNEDGSAARPGGIGWYVQHVHFGKTYKPKMLAYPGSAGIAAIKKIYSNFKNRPDSQANMLMDLNALLAATPKIAAIAGEMTFAIHSDTGHVYLLGLAPGQQNQPGGEELAAKATQGLKNLLSELH